MTLTAFGELSVREARNKFLAAHALDAASYATPRFSLHIGRWRVRVPNPGLLPLHDLHHVATGFGSGLVGEAEVSAFELRTGWGNLAVLGLCLGAVLFGAVTQPRRVWHAWTRSRGTRGLYRCGREYEDLLDMTVAELRGYMAIPPEGLASAAPCREGRKHERTGHE